MDQNSIQPRRPELVVLWHWLIVVAIALVALLCLGQAPFVGVGLFGWSIWATKTGIAFTQDQDAALLAMQRVHRSLKYTAGFGVIGSLLLALFLLPLGAAALIAILIVPSVTFPCLFVWLISCWVTQILDKLDINS